MRSGNCEDGQISHWRRWRKRGGGWQPNIQILGVTQRVPLLGIFLLMRFPDTHSSYSLNSQRQNPPGGKKN